jgi:hypothetical protein
MFDENLSAVTCRDMKYQLVLQFQAESMMDFDELVVLEDLLIDKLPPHPIRSELESTASKAAFRARGIRANRGPGGTLSSRWTLTESCKGPMQTRMKGSRVLGYADRAGSSFGR